MKRCYKCKLTHESDNFYKDKSRKDNLSNICKFCASKYNKKYNKINGRKINKQHINYQKTSNTYKKYRSLYEKTPKYKFYIYKQSAKTRSILFNITFKQFITLWQKPCYYCKSSIETIGLDRIDNDKGYELDNIIPCCKICNRMKHTMDQIDFINHCAKITS